jgi:hypothetical protein
LERLLIIIFLFLFSLAGFSQRIYKTEYKDSAKYCIYESLFKSDSTYSVYVVKDTTEFIGQGNWYFVNDKSKADFILYFTNDKSEAKFRVYYVDNPDGIKERHITVTKKNRFSK